MNFKAIMGGVSYTLKKYAPEILLGVGITGVVVSTVLSCKATLKAEAILDEHAEQSERIDDCVLVRETSDVNYSIQEEKHDRLVLLSATGGKFIRLYGPSGTLMLFSLGCILASYRIMRTRNVALMAAYKLMEEAFMNYRKRVSAELGDRADSHFLYGEEMVEGTARTVTEEDGTEHEMMVVKNNLSGFHRFFEAEKPNQIGGWTGSTQWSKVHEYNLSFLEHKEEHFTNMLAVRGLVTMNDVFSELGFEPTEAGMVVGWKYNSERGDNYISFRPRNVDGNWAFGQNGCGILLDFNFDGVVFDPTVARKEVKQIK